MMVARSEAQEVKPYRSKCFAPLPLLLLVGTAIVAAGCVEPTPENTADPFAKYIPCPYQKDVPVDQSICARPIALPELGNDARRSGRCVVDEVAGGVHIEIYERNDGEIVFFGTLTEAEGLSDSPTGVVMVKSDSFEFRELVRYNRGFSMEVGRGPTTVELELFLMATEIENWSPGPFPSSYQTVYVDHEWGPWPTLKVHAGEETYWLNHGIRSNGKIKPINMSLRDNVTIDVQVINVAQVHGSWQIDSAEPQEILMPRC